MIIFLTAMCFFRQGQKSQQLTLSNTPSDFMILSPPFCPNRRLRLEHDGGCSDNEGHILVRKKILLWVMGPLYLLQPLRNTSQIYPDLFCLQFY